MNRLKQALMDETHFSVIAELTAGRGYKIDPVVNFLSDFKEDGAASIPSDFCFAGIALPQNPGGVSNLDWLSWQTAICSTRLILFLT